MQVEAAAAQYLPFPINEIRLDFDIIGPHGDDEIDVLLAVARAEKSMIASPLSKPLASNRV